MCEGMKGLVKVEEHATVSYEVAQHADGSTYNGMQVWDCITSLTAAIRHGS